MIPSTLHLDLLKHEVIGDPFVGGNAKELGWVSECVVRYTRRFGDEELGAWAGEGRAVEIVFHGIDTYANVTLNGQLILQTDNAFKTYRVRIEPLLNPSPTPNIL